MCAWLPACQDGATPLHYASTRGHVKVIRLIAEYHGNLDAEDNDGRTAVHWAASSGKLEAVNELAQAGARIAAVDKVGSRSTRLLSSTDIIIPIDSFFFYGGVVLL